MKTLHQRSLQGHKSPWKEEHAGKLGVARVHRERRLMRNAHFVATFLATAFLLFGHASSSEAEPVTPPPAKREVVTVSGDVRSPGRIPWSSDLTLMSAIASVGGFGWRAPREVFIIRGTEKITARPKPILKGTETDPKLQPGDKVEVPQ